MIPTKCEWCSKEFPGYGKLIVHARIKDGIPNCPNNPYVGKSQLD